MNFARVFGDKLLRLSVGESTSALDRMNFAHVLGDR